MASAPPRVSVVIAAYNAAPWIIETVESVLAQEYPDFETIIVDDGSGDATRQLLKPYLDRLTYVWQPNAGQPSARNTGIRIASGALIAFVDADDLWIRDKLKRQVALFIDRPELGLVYSDAVYFADGPRAIVAVARKGLSQLPEGDVFRRLFVESFIPSATPLVRKTLFDRVGCFSEDPRHGNNGGEDWEMWLRIAAVAQVGCVQHPLAAVRLHPQSMGRTARLEDALAGRLAVVEANAARCPERLGPYRQKALAKVYEGVAYLHLGRGHRTEARRLFLSALRLVPLSLGALVGSALTFAPRAAVTFVKTARRAVSRAAFARNATWT
jgi:hypothetical protein